MLLTETSVQQWISKTNVIAVKVESDQLTSNNFDQSRIHITMEETVDAPPTLSASERPAPSRNTIC